jgi:hypothetical protein
MTHQLALTVITKVKPGELEALKQLLGSIAANRNQPQLIPFEELLNLHFARFFLTDLSETVKDLRGKPIQPSLVFESSFDAPLSTHLQDLVTVAADGFDKIFSHCEGYPAQRTQDSRMAYLKAHQVASKPFYVNTPGRTVQQIRQEAQLRQTIGKFLNSRSWAGETAQGVRQAIQEFVRSQPTLTWAQSPPELPALAWRLQETGHKLGMPLLLVGLVLLPILLLGWRLGVAVIVLILVIAIVLLRINEEREIPDRSSADPAMVRKLRADEDFGVQNQVVAIGFFKPSLFRKILSRLVLELADYLIRHIYNRGSLSGLNTLHFARWVILDDGRRLFFTSNYDGSLESYMNDFIDKAYWGLNAIFCSGEGFPKTRWLFLGGIQDEMAYKTFLPTRQVPTQIWYSAYPDLSTVNIQNNALIRQGLFAQLNPAETDTWLRRF